MLIKGKVEVERRPVSLTSNIFHILLCQLPIIRPLSNPKKVEIPSTKFKQKKSCKRNAEKRKETETTNETTAILCNMAI